MPKPLLQSFFRPLEPWRPFGAFVRRARASRSDELPSWSLSDLAFSSAQMSWLQRSLLGWHAVPRRREAPICEAGWSFDRLSAWLAADGIELHACRLAGLRDLQRGDVLILRDDEALRLFGQAAIGGGGMALVIDAGPERLRLSPALAPDPLSCRGRELAPALVGWVLRSRYVGPELRRPDGTGRGDALALTT